ncbi:anti-anti-sigma factor [Lentzea fradiae]|uniref:Anti-anti-sigma factor n=1 Tax=Lentzea fradiae TaxID=200378 RepID=A0A1G7P322_9PSEU|nr:STAS domain-containing protein [Lentzea fradiae]SDF80631.1 anti-anti-sigma factor [Lentzea fradiae]
MTACETSPFTVRTYRSGNRFVAVCRGEMDVTTCEMFFASVLPGITDPAVDEVVVDLTDVTFLAASGLRSLLLLLFATHHTGRTFDLVNAQPQVRRVLDLFGFTTVKAGLVWETAMSPRGGRR